VVLYELLTGRHPFVPGDRKRPRPVRDFLPDFEYHDLEEALRAALRYRPEERTPTMAELREGLELARECLLAQREHVAAAGKIPALDPTPTRPEQVAAAAVAPAQVSTPTQQEHADAAVPTASMEVTTVARPVDGPGVAANDVATPCAAPPHELACVVPPQPRSRFTRTPLAAVLGLAVGVGGTLGLRADGDATHTTERTVLMARLELELARASAAERRADHCEAEVVRQKAAEVPTTPPTPPPTPPSPLLAPEEPAARVLAATSRSAGPDGPRSRAPSPKVPQSRELLASKVRACARKGGITGQIKVQVRRQGGEIDAVKVLKYTKDHPSFTCIDAAIRGADLPAGDRPVETFTFPE
jgi:hypothetical protein